jgi:hypothetical protein
MTQAVAYAHTYIQTISLPYKDRGRNENHTVGTKNLHSRLIKIL